MMLSMFQIKQYMLPHEGVIPGGPGHKKQVIPAGTKVYCIVYGTKMFWAVYLREEQAQKCLKGLLESLDPKARRHIPLNSLIAWNFKSAFPKRVSRLPTK